MPTKINSLEDVFYDALRDIYHAEKQLLKALPKMAKAATCEDLSSGFEKHLEETEIHCNRLEKIFDMIGREAKPKPCEAMKGLIEEGKEAIEAKTSNGFLHDELLVNAARKVEHYEMATYCTLGVWAEKLKLDAVGQLLKQTYDDEKSCDDSLRAHAEQDADELEGNNEVNARDEELVGAEAFTELNTHE
jgi:ferritin-like metal-binding protein YciE